MVISTSVKNPYPLDIYLNDGEPPFTQFGHLGEDAIDLRVFDQNTYWVDKYGHGYLLAEMSPEYLSAVLEHLLTHSGQYLLSHSYYYEELIHYTHTFPSSNPMMFALASLGYSEDYYATSGRDWVQNTPIFQKIFHLLKEYESDSILSA